MAGLRNKIEGMRLLEILLINHPSPQDILKIQQSNCRPKQLVEQALNVT
jgi:hypothetical protein